MADKDDLNEKLDEIDKKFDVISIRKHYKARLLSRINKGEIGLISELEALERLEKGDLPGVEGQKKPEQETNPESPASDPEEDFGIPQKLRIPRRPYTMSAAARKQREDAANTPAKSKAMEGNRNAWKTGEYAKGFIRQIFRPCKSTCPQFPCAMVDDGETEPGASCLDKVQVVKNIQAIQTAIVTGDLTDYKDLASVRIAGLSEVLGMLIEDVTGENTILKSEIFNKEGVLLGHKIVSHPSLLPMIKLAEQLEMTPSQFLATPLIQKKNQAEEKVADALSTIMAQGN